MKIGIDIDNTILDYSDSFRKHAEFILDASLPGTISKSEIQKLVVESKGENSWTELQGVVYSEDPLDARVFEGFMDFYARSALIGAEIKYVSHKTKVPIIGPKRDMRTPVIKLLESEGILSPKGHEAQVVFCETIQEKIHTIQQQNFDYFIDDLFRILEPLSLTGIKCLHFRCECDNPSMLGHLAMENWTKIEWSVFGDS